MASASDGALHLSPSSPDVGYRAGFAFFCGGIAGALCNTRGGDARGTGHCGNLDRSPESPDISLPHPLASVD
eukprot:gene476-11237_t